MNTVSMKSNFVVFLSKYPLRNDRLDFDDVIRLDCFGFWEVRATPSGSAGESLPCLVASINIGVKGSRLQKPNRGPTLYTRYILPKDTVY